MLLIYTGTHIDMEFDLSVYTITLLVEGMMYLQTFVRGTVVDNQSQQKKLNVDLQVTI